MFTKYQVTMQQNYALGKIFKHTRLSGKTFVKLTML